MPVRRGQVGGQPDELAGPEPVVQQRRCAVTDVEGRHASGGVSSRSSWSITRYMKRQVFRYAIGMVTETRWLNDDEQVAWRRLIAVTTLLPYELDAQLQRDADLTHFEYWVLAMLSEAPRPCASHERARTSGRPRPSRGCRTSSGGSSAGATSPASDRRPTVAAPSHGSPTTGWRGWPRSPLVTSRQCAPSSSTRSRLSRSSS